MTFLRTAPYLALIAAFAMIGWQIQDNRTLRAELATAEQREANLTSEVQALEYEVTQATVARQIAMLEVERQRGLVAEYDAVRRAFIQGDTNAPLPDDFRAAIERLLERAQDDSSDPDRSAGSGSDPVGDSDGSAARD